MNATRASFKSAKMGLVVLAFTAVVPAGAQTADRPVLWVGEVTANDVYVRSGNSTNHYTICKLNAGARLNVVSESGEWCEVLPPEGTFSLVSGEFVDTTDDRTGIVNGENVRIRAGSLINENKYTVQGVLAKGAPVTILGRNPDGFLRIKPPPGATVWINRSYLARLGEGAAASLPSVAAGEVGVRAAATGDTPAGAQIPGLIAAASGSEPVSSDWPFPGIPPTPQRRELVKIDADLKSEVTKPMSQRQLVPLMERYQPIAAQSEDDFAKRYAEGRLTQVDALTYLSKGLHQISGLDERADTTRRQLLAERASMPKVLPPPPVGLDAQGELRESSLYSSLATPRRFRLVDPEQPAGRTIGYVEIPPDSTIRVEEYLGRYVGVRAVEKRLQVGAVDPVPIYVVGELIPLQRPGEAVGG